MFQLPSIGSLINIDNGPLDTEALLQSLNEPPTSIVNRRENFVHLVNRNEGISQQQAARGANLSQQGNLRVGGPLFGQNNDPTQIRRPKPPQVRQQTRNANQEQQLSVSQQTAKQDFQQRNRQQLGIQLEEPILVEEENNRYLKGSNLRPMKRNPVNEESVAITSSQTSKI